MDSRLETLLQHPALWRARSGSGGTAGPVISTGIQQLDERLPGGGWPAQGLMELLLERPGGAELRLLFPALATLQALSAESWIVLVAPPYEPYAPALAARGIDLERLLVIRTPEVLWAMEQALHSRACRAVVGWLPLLPSAPMQALRRLQLAATQSGSLCVVCRPVQAGREPSPAILRLSLAAEEEGLVIRAIKNRGKSFGKIRVGIEQEL